MGTKHDPLPWSVQNKGDLLGKNARHEIVQGEVDISDPSNIPHRRTIVKMPDLSERSYANAAFIVQCVNSHDDLLAACKAMLPYMPCYQGLAPTDSGLGAMIVAQNAIAKVEWQDGDA